MKKHTSLRARIVYDSSATRRRVIPERLDNDTARLLAAGPVARQAPLAPRESLPTRSGRALPPGLRGLFGLDETDVLFESLRHGREILALDAAKDRGFAVLFGHRLFSCAWAIAVNTLLM